jgi:hypothetical protein
LVDYRAGAFDPAVEQLAKLINAEAENQFEGIRTQASLQATAHTVFAMAAHRAKHQMIDVELQMAKHVVQTIMPKPERGERFGDDWQDWLRCQILLREAEALIEGRPRSKE